VKQLEEPQVHFGGQLVSFEVYQQEKEYKEFAKEIKSYSARYEHEYLEVLKNTEIGVIRAVNSKFPELSCNAMLSQQFYLAYCQYFRETIRAVNHGVAAQEQEPAHPRTAAAQYQAVDSLTTYLSVIEQKFKGFQASKSNRFSNFSRKVVMDYRMTLLDKKDYLGLRAKVKEL
jgi:hypothetical protein